MVYDITDSITFEAIKTWYEEIFEYARENVAVILVGNKSDLDSERQVSFEEGQALANYLNNISFVETSAKEGRNVDETFQMMTRQIRASITEAANNQGSKLSLGLTNKIKQKKACC